MMMLTRGGSFPDEEESRQQRAVYSQYSSRLKRHKKPDGSHDFLGRYKTRDAMSMAQRKITRKDLDFYLYGRTDVSPVKLEEGSPEEERMKQQSIACKIPNYAEKSVDILQLRYKPGVENEFRTYEEFNKVLVAIKHIPAQLHLCYSSVPGAGFGICATEIIPSGTWIGPYEGTRVSIEEMRSMLDTRYVWEIYRNGVLNHGINGIELGKTTWCWMKYIQCARNTDEQNAVAFQFGADIYFRTYKAISPGEEILVWYAEYYEQYHGIPVGVRKLAKKKKTSQTVTTKTSGSTESNIDIIPTAKFMENQRLIKRDVFATATSQPPPLSSYHVRRPSLELSPTSTQVDAPRPSLSPENQPPSIPPKCGHPPTLSRDVEEVQISSQPVVTQTMTSQEKMAESSTDISLAIQNLKTRFWKCAHCLSNFPQKWALQVHNCPCEVTKPYKCSNCGRAYVDKDDVQAHAQRCGSGRQYKCGYCGRSFVNVNILSKHLRVHSRKTVASSFKRQARVPTYKRLVQ